MTSVLIVASLGFFAYLMLFSGLSGDERIRVTICFVLIVAAAFFWAAFEQQPTKAGAGGTIFYFS